MTIRQTIQLLIKAYGAYKIQIAALAVLGFFSAIFESIGVTTLIPIFSRFTGEVAANDAVSRAFISILNHFDLGLAFKALLAVIVFAFVLKSLFLLAAYYVSARITANYAWETRGRLLGGMLCANWPFLTKQKGGFLETLLIKDVESARSLLASIGDWVVHLINLVVYVAIAFTISYNITVLSLALGGVIFLLLKPFLYRVKEMAGKQAQAISGMNHYVGESIWGMKTVKTGLAAGAIYRKANEYFAILRDMHIRIKLLGRFPSLLSQPISVAFIVTVFAVLYLTGNFQLGMFVVTMYLIHRIFTHLQNIQNMLYGFNEWLPYLVRVVEFDEELIRNKEHHGGKNPFVFDESLEFRNVKFAYEPKRSVLSGIDARIKRGEMVGIVGKSGSGKTTIADLFLRLVRPSEGNIVVDGVVDICEINIQAWRKNIAYVAQDALLFNDSVANNIRFYDDSIGDLDMHRAAKQAYIYDFIQKLPQKFMSEVGERGVLLSGGEKQRIVLARALAKNPKILILDEATSALDNESELMIQKAIEELKGKMTIIVIAHRLSTLLNCDKVIFLENGRVNEEGPPQKLLEDKNSSFYKLYNIRENV